MNQAVATRIGEVEFTHGFAEGYPTPDFEVFP